uniref:Elongation factor 1-gamma 3 n=1 Tax=Arundo donax TaxID=35708 RepID=A0A0A9GT34_ARUDO
MNGLYSISFSMFSTETCMLCVFQVSGICMTRRATPCDSVTTSTMMRTHFKVKAVWLFRGQDIPKFVMDEIYDMELYEWTKVDISDEAQKERVSAMIEDQEPSEGEALLDAKWFVSLHLAGGRTRP